MFFAVRDLLRYRFRWAHYGDDPRKNILALGHTRRVAKETLELLEPGDIIICQRMNSLMSWAVMHFGGGYAVDHLAIYIGEGQVVHATLAGVKENSIHILARGARVLPFRPISFDEAAAKTPPLPPKDSQAAAEAHVPKLDRTAGSPEAVLNPYLQLMLVGIEIVLGLRPTSFRWRYYIDIGIVAGLLDLLLWPVNHFPMIGTVWLAWLLVLISIRVRFHRQLRSGRAFEPDSHPGLVIRWMWAQGGHIFPGKPVNGRWKIRAWPAWQVPSSPQQTMPQSQNQLSDRESSTFDQ